MYSDLLEKNPNVCRRVLFCDDSIEIESAWLLYEQGSNKVCSTKYLSFLVN